MTTLFVRHQVKDFTVFQQAYRDAGPMQKRAGVLSESVFQAYDNPNDVTVTHQFTSLAEAKALVESAELKEAMEKAGVIGPPMIWFAHKL